MKLESSDPDQLQEFVKPATGLVSIHPTASAFDMSVELYRTEKLGLFWVRSSAMRVTKEPPHDMYCLNVPLGSPFYARSHGRKQLYGPQSAYLLSEQEYFDFEAVDGKCHVLVMNIFDDQFREKTCKLLKLDGERQVSYSNSINLDNDNMRGLLRGLANTISDITGPEAANVSWDIITREREDELITRLILASGSETGHWISSGQLDSNRMAQVEEYLAAHLHTPVERWKLAEIADTSIRNLSRWFIQRHGMGPMAFLKQRRLDMTYLKLLGAGPDEVAVTDVAMKYGFNHLGRFAAEYAQAFGESPSTTLRH